MNRLFGSTNLMHHHGVHPSFGGLDGFRRGLAHTAECLTHPIWRFIAQALTV